MPTMPKERLEKLLTTLEQRIEELLAANNIEEMTGYEREQCAARYGLLIMRLLELQHSQQEEPDMGLSGNALIARVIGLTVTDAGE